MYRVRLSQFLMKSVLLIFLVGLAVSCASSATAPKPYPVEFSLDNEVRDYARITLPVKIKGVEEWFLLDTGASATILDSSYDIPAKQHTNMAYVATPGDPILISTFRLSDAFLDRFPIPEEPVYRVKVFDERGRNIKGVIGMNFLKKYIVQIDFYKNTLAILDPASKPQTDWGMEIPLYFNEGGIPYVKASLPGHPNIEMMVDTGASSSSLSSAIFNAYTARNKIRTLGYYVMTASGTYLTKRGWINGLTVGPYEYNRVDMTRTAMAHLGLKFLSQHRVTFDFPNSKLYLKR